MTCQKLAAQSLLNYKYSSNQLLHITLPQSYLSASPVPCSGSHLITLYPVPHTGREAGVHAIWQDSLEHGTRAKADESTNSKIPADQVAISNSQAVSPICHKALCLRERSWETALWSWCVSTNQKHSADSTTAAGLIFFFFTASPCTLCFHKLKLEFCKTLIRCRFDECPWIHAWLVTLADSSKHNVYFISGAKWVLKSHIQAKNCAIIRRYIISTSTIFRV